MKSINPHIGTMVKRTSKVTNFGEREALVQVVIQQMAL